MIRILIALTFLTTAAYAQKENLNVRDPRLNEGSLFTISLTPADKRIVIAVAGKPQAELSPDHVVVFGREIMAGGKKRELTIRPSGVHFEILNASEIKNPVEIEVQDRADTKKKETFRIQKLH